MKAWKVELKDGNTRFVGAEAWEVDPNGALLFYNRQVAAYIEPQSLMTVAYAPGLWVCVHEALGVHIPNAQQRHAMIGTPEPEEQA